jgi:hypothetical protein
MSFRRPHLVQTAFVAAVLLIQAITHLFWLTISAHSGQVAIPYMMNRGMILFGNLLEQHAPATSYIAAFAQRLLPFEPVDTVRLLNTGLVLLISILVYQTARRLTAGSWLAGNVALLTWFLWEPVFGNVMFYFNTVMGFFILLALGVWLTWHERRPFLAALLTGLLLGAATLGKQHAWGAVIVMGAALLVYAPQANRNRQIAVYLLGVAVLPLALIAVMIAQGTLDQYVYWNWTFNLSGLMPNELPTGDFLRKVLLSTAFVPAFVLLANRQTERHAWIMTLLAGVGGSLPMLPRFGEVSAMGMLPFAAIMSGAVIGTWWRGHDVRRMFRPSTLRTLTTSQSVLASVLIVLGFSVVWAVGAPYLKHEPTPAHDEFLPLVEHLDALSETDDTLFVLPETDSTPQLHSLSGLLPPSTWIKGWFWYLIAPTAAGQMSDQLLAEWSETPPTFIVYFPVLAQTGSPGIEPLADFMRDRYELVESVPAVRFHGDAEIYRLRQ